MKRNNSITSVNMTATAVVHRNAEKQEAHLIFTSPTPVQAPLSMEFSRQEYWSGLPCPPPGNLPNSGTDPGLLHRKWTFPQLSHQGSLRTVERAAHPFSRGPSWPRNQTRPPALQGDSLPAEPPGKPQATLHFCLNIFTLLKCLLWLYLWCVF